MKYKDIKVLFLFANRIFRYRRDVLADQELDQLLQTRTRLKVIINEKKRSTLTPEIQSELEQIDQFLLKIGGKIYPKTFWIDNVEVGLVALIIVIGIRSFFFQPFIIPTNSMYPTYSGMNAEVYDLKEPELNLKKKVFNSLLLGSRNYFKTSAYAGRVSIPLFSQAQYSKDARLRSQGFVSFDYVKGKKWFGMVPTMLREYTIYVGNNPVKIQVPADFSLDQVLIETYFKNYKSFRDLLADYHSNNRIDVFKDTRHRIKSTSVLNKGDAVISFDITSGDALFVDRFSYHFMKPKIGDPFVFKTGTIEVDANLQQSLGDKYYIKRLAGKGAESLSIREGQLFVGERLRDEVAAFVDNSEKNGAYNGYQAIGYLEEGTRAQIPERHYFALGDNSYNSFDSRHWGYVPEDSLVGKALFIYYPFTQRWGVAK